MSAADYLSLVRIPLGVVFLLVAARPPLALGVLAVAGLSDVLDGWIARRSRPPGDHARHRGDWLDPLCDKLFVASVAAGLYLTSRPPVGLLAVLMARELLQTGAMLVLRFVPALHRVARAYSFRAHPIGKATTVAQFLAGAGLLVGHPAAPAVAYAAGALGVVTVAIYVARLRALLPAPSPRATRSETPRA